VLEGLLIHFLLPAHIPRRKTHISSSFWGSFLGHKPERS